MVIKNSDNTSRNRTRTFKPVVPLHDNESNNCQHAIITSED